MKKTIFVFLTLLVTENLNAVNNGFSIWTVDDSRVGESSIIIKQELYTGSPFDDPYESTSFQVGLSEIADVLNCAISEIELKAKNSDGNYTDSTAKNGGFWFDLNGHVTTWASDGAAFFIEPEIEGTLSRLRIGQYPSRFKGGEVMNTSLYFVYGSQYYEYKITLKINELSSIINPDFDQGNISGWSVTDNLSAQYQDQFGVSNIELPDGTIIPNGYYNEETGSWISQFIESWTVPSSNLADGKIYQVIKNLPAGSYRLLCDAIACNQEIGKQNNVGVFLYATCDGKTTKTSISTADGCPERTELTFVCSGGSIELGLLVQKSTANWIAADNFKLAYSGEVIDPEPYAVLSNNNTVLTFYYDNQKAARNGMSVGLFNSASERSWNDYCSYITTVVFDASFANCTTLTSTRYWFAFCRNLTSVTGISNLNTENVKDMGCMFEGCTSLKSLDLSTLNTDKALYMDMMFYNCSSLTSLDLSGFNTSNVTDMGLMFYSCPGLTSLDLSSFNTNNVTRMDHMFEKCSSLTKIIVGKDWSTAKVAESDYMFTDCTKLVGGKGTKYNTNYTDKTYAHIDGGTGNPGYFTDKNAATICDTPQITRDGTSNRIIMTCATAEASIYYTTNGTTPTANNTRYTGSITVSQNCVIKAIAVKEGYDNSSVATYSVDWFKVATPTFSYNNLQLTISTTTTNATIYYTTDGSTPTTSSTKYTGPLSLTENTTLKAIAVKEDFNNSDVATYNFVKDDQTCQTPQVSRDGTSNRVVMTCGTSGASIYYTTDNSAPTSGSTLYTGPITVNRNLTIRAIAMKDGMFNSSQSLFDVDWFKVESPTFTYTNLQLIISTTTSGASIYYTTNGSDPLADLSRAILFTAPVRLESDAVVKAVAVKTDFSNSEVATFTFVKADYTCQQPEIKRDGTSDRLMMSCEEANAQIYYTIDGSTPTTSSLRYTGPITMPYNCTVRAIAARSDLFPSEVSEFIVDWLTVSAVSVAYNNGVLALSCATEGAEIHYAIGGTDATKESPLYTGPITLTDNREVRYVVYASGYAPISGSYTPTDFACAPATLTYDGLNIELTTTEKDATIYYTTDGSIPTTLSARYTGKTPLTGLCTISAIVVKQYKNNSEVMMEPVTYFFDGATVYLAASGHVEDALKWRGTDNLEYLTIECQGQSGALSATDTKFIRTIQDLKHLNMANARFENNTIPDGAFNDMNIVSIEFPSKNITTMGNVFSGCKHLAAIIWNARVVMAPTAAAAGITNPNLLLYVDNKVYAPQGVRNVIANGSASSIVLTDEEGGSYYCPQAFQAQSISYTHTYNQKTGMNECRGWETIALPFDVQNIKHETAGRIVPFAAKDETARSFWLGELDYSGFKKASEIKAYTPYIISMPNNEVYGNSYILSGKVTFEAVNTTVPVTDIKTTSKGDHVFTPCFDHVEASPMVYAINKNDQGTNFAEGSVFLPSYREVKPFEAYISIPSNGVAPRYIPIRDNDETGIMELQNIGIMDLQNGTYDLTGRKVQGELHRGVYIIDGKKLMVK